eukprot:sb/3470863/
MGSASAGTSEPRETNALVPSATWVSYEYPKYPATNSIDQDLRTCSVADRTTGNWEVWHIVEFPSTYKIGKVVLYFIFYNSDGFGWNSDFGYCLNSMINWNYCLSNYYNTGVYIYEGDQEKANCGTLELDRYGYNQSQQIYSFDCHGAVGDRVKLVKTATTLGNNEIVVCELVVLGIMGPNALGTDRVRKYWSLIG